MFSSTRKLLQKAAEDSSPQPPAAPEAITVAATKAIEGSSRSSSSSSSSSMFRFIGRVVRGSIRLTWNIGLYTTALVGVSAILATSLNNRGNDSNDDGIFPKLWKGSDVDDKKEKKKALLIPFHKIVLVKSDERKRGFESKVFQAFRKDEKIEMTTAELVDLIYRAAADPTITSLYGVFSSYEAAPPLANAGWADLEEIHNALRVFRESNRVHYEPTIRYNRTKSAVETIVDDEKEKSEIKPKVEKHMIAYADTLGGFDGTGDKMYYLASAFTTMYLQQNGSLNLLGLMSTHIFMRNFLEKYGFVTHVFKHGMYKNAPNTFTENKMDAPHYENVKNIIDGLNESICEDITRMRAPFFANLIKEIHTGSRRSDSEGGSRLGNMFGKSEMDGWSRIQGLGPLSAQAARTAGLVDELPVRDPFGDVAEVNTRRAFLHKRLEASRQLFDVSSASNKAKQDDNESESPDAYSKLKEELIKLKEQHTKLIEEKENQEESRISARLCELFPTSDRPQDIKIFGNAPEVQEIVSLSTYAKQVRIEEPMKFTGRLSWLNEDKPKRELSERRLGSEWDQIVSSAGETFKELGFGKSGMPHSFTSPQRVALVYVEGALTGKNVERVVESIRQIRNDDCACVVLRVSSPGGEITSCEKILQEVKALKIPVVVSFGNYAASGGYYISTAADCIFASNKTITGSIGVFTIRLDLTGLASKYGINVGHALTGEWAGLYNPLYPLSKKMETALSNQTSDYYSQFKRVVAEGRGLSMDQVEEIAQGRVWLGNQARDRHLVDRIGGLQRALAYAKEQYTYEPEIAVVVEYPKPGSFMQKLQKLWEWRAPHASSSALGTDTSLDIYREWMIREASSGRLPGTLGGVYLTADENYAIRCMLEEAVNQGGRGGGTN